MKDLKISINKLDDISWLVEAANDLADATENDLAAIKQKKWYHRLLDTITFSKDNQIQIAKDIGSLAKLQEIVIRVLVMLSKENTAISTVVRQHAELLQCLSIKDTALMNAIKKIKFGGTAQIDFADLGRDKKALITNLLIMADPDVQKSNYSQRYIGSIMQRANVATVDNTVHADAVESLSKVEQELLYRMIMINRYLADISFSAPSEVIDWISLNQKRKREICTDIDMTGNAASPEYFATYYEKASDTYDEIIDDDIMFECDKQQTDIPDSESLDEDGETIPPSEYQDVIISGILHIPENETYRFEHQILHVQTIIDCEGNLEFADCTIHYCENESISQIKVKDKGLISARNCTFVCHDYRKQQFIQVEAYEGEVVFWGCKFVNCCTFVSLQNNLIMDKCEVINPGGSFIIADGSSKVGTITGTNFVFADMPDFVARCHGDIIRGSDLTFTENTVTGLLRIESAAVANKLYQDSIRQFNRGYFIDTGKLTVNNTCFVGMQQVISCGSYLTKDASTISHSTFEHCINIISSKWSKGGMGVKGCQFTKCMQVARGAEKGDEFTHCSFLSCFNTLISSMSSSGGILIDYCEFIKWTAAESEERSGKLTDAMLEFYRGAGKECYANTVRNCIFEGIDAKEYFVIKGSVVYGKLEIQ